MNKGQLEKFADDMILAVLDHVGADHDPEDEYTAGDLIDLLETHNQEFERAEQEIKRLKPEVERLTKAYDASHNRERELSQLVQQLEGALFAALWLVPLEKLSALVAEHPIAAKHQPPF